MKICFVGLGVMGGPMAGHLLQAGHTVQVFNRSHQKAVDWQERYGGAAFADLNEAASGAEVLITCVGNDDDLRQICLGSSGVYAQLARGALHVDHTTASAGLARELSAAAQEQGLEFVDAPVSGGEAGAINGQLTIMCGGSTSAYTRASEIFPAYARMHGHIGDVGSGQLAKMVNQICIGGLVQGLAEAIKFGETAQLDMDKVMAVIEQGAAGSWQMQNRAGTMHKREFDFGFAVDWMRKDLGILLAEAKALGLELPITKTVSGYYDEISAAGGGRWDTSSLITRLDDSSD